MSVVIVNEKVKNMNSQSANMIFKTAGAIGAAESQQDLAQSHGEKIVGWLECSKTGKEEKE